MKESCHDIADILLKKELNTNQSINQSWKSHIKIYLNIYENIFFTV